MGRLENKVPIVTSGSKGIGETIAERYVEKSAKIIITARHTEEGGVLANKLGENVLFIHIIVNNAEIGVYADVEKINDDN